MNNCATWCSAASEASRGGGLHPALAADPWEADGDGPVVPAAGNGHQPTTIVCCTQGFEEEVPSPGTETCHVALSKSFKPPLAPAAMCRTSKVPAGAL